MARINVEQKALTDSRFALLGVSIAPEQSAVSPATIGLGVMLLVWNECQEREVYSLSESSINSIGYLAGIRNQLTELLVKSELGKRVRGKRVRICGTRGRIEWLKERRKEGREGGKKGGRPRKPLGVDGPITPGGRRQKTPPAPAPAPAPALTDPEKTLAQLALSGCDDATVADWWNGAAFDEFWAGQVRKVGKADARKAWAKLCPKTSGEAESLLNRIADVWAERAVEWKQRKVEHIPHPATFLRREEF